MKQQQPIGLDIGTSTSSVAIYDSRGNATLLQNSEGEDYTPSVVGIQKDGTMIFGREASNQALANPDSTFRSFKLDLTSNEKLFQDFTAFHLMVAFLTKMKQDVEQATGENITEVVIAIPANYRDDKRQKFLDAAKQAGLNVVQLVPEPTAAGIAYSLNNSKSECVIVFDLGGGTFDVSALQSDDGEVAVLGTNGTQEGGDDFTRVLEEDLLSKFTEATGITPDRKTDHAFFQDLWGRAEQTKFSLGVRERTQVTLGAAGKYHTIEITRSEYLALIRPLIHQLIETTRQLLTQCGLTWDDVNKVLQVGGGALTIGVTEALEAECGKKVSQDIHPMKAVALGAAIQAASLSADPEGNLHINERVLPAPKISVQDCTAHSIGCCVDDPLLNEICAVIIPRNTPIPCEKEDLFGLKFPDQKHALIQILQGEDGAKVSECLVIGEIKLSDLPVDASMPKRIRVRYKIDHNGMCTAEAEDLISGKKKIIEFDYSKSVTKVAA